MISADSGLAVSSVRLRLLRFSERKAAALAAFGYRACIAVFAALTPIDPNDVRSHVGEQHPAVRASAMKRPKSMTLNPRQRTGRDHSLHFRCRHFFGLQARLVFFNEGLDLTGNREQFVPLLLIQRHRKTAKPIYRYRAFLADFHGNRPACACLVSALLLLGLQSLRCSSF